MPTSDSNIKAEVICDSVGPKFGRRLTTMIITYPRIVLAELNTHRVFSKSTASSRAIPINKQIEKVKRNPFIPSWIGKNQSGMQALEELNEEDQKLFKFNWLSSSGAMCQMANRLSEIGVHKQIANRLIEPWLYVTTIISGTDWANFFNLRCHPAAQPEIMVLAYRMLEAYMESAPVSRDTHIPFGDKMEPGLSERDKMKVACARCARISYETHDGKMDYEADLKLADKLIKDGHMSPFEHVAKEFQSDVYVGNFRSWVQYRKTINGENTININYEKLLDRKPSWI